MTYLEGNPVYGANIEVIEVPPRSEQKMAVSALYPHHNDRAKSLTSTSYVYCKKSIFLPREYTELSVVDIDMLIASSVLSLYIQLF